MPSNNNKLRATTPSARLDVVCQLWPSLDMVAQCAIVQAACALAVLGDDDAARVVGRVVGVLAGDEEGAHVLGRVVGLLANDNENSHTNTSTS